MLQLLIVVSIMADNSILTKEGKIYNYYVVEFVQRGKKSSKKRSVDIIVGKWLTVHPKSNKLSAKYPPEPWTDMRQKLIDMVDPLEDWSTYSVIVRGKADDLEDAETKLQDLNYDISVLTLSDADDNEEEAEKRITQSVIQSKLLQSAQAMRSLLDKERNGSFTVTQASKTLNNGKSKTKKANDSFAQNKKQQNLTHKEDDSKTVDDFSLILESVHELSKSVQRLIFLGEENLSETRSLKVYISKKMNENTIFVGTAHQLGLKYDLQIPIQTPEDFILFDSRLEDINSKFFSDVNLISTSGIDTKDCCISKSLINILKMFLSKSLALNFTASKKVPGKQVLKSTNFCNLVYSLIKEKRLASNLTATDMEFSQAMTKVLSNVPKWKDDLKLPNSTNPPDKPKQNDNLELLASFSVVPITTDDSLLEADDEEED